jgi:predicted nucleic acid-binding protein
MAGSPVLIDSSYYIGLGRQGLDPLQALATVAVERDLATCGIVRCEVARGIKQPSVLKRFQKVWNAMLYVPTDNSLWEEAEHLAWQLDRTGNILPLQDVLIACCAKRVDAVILTFDRHFQSIPGIRATDRLF